MSNKFEVGIVFKWKEYPYSHNKNVIKDRWFVYLGETSPYNGNIEIISYIATTTTKLEKYNKGGERENHKFVKFEKAKYPIFDKDCILDLDMREPCLIKKELEECNKIEIIGKIDNQTMKIIYKKICESKKFTKKEKMDIYNSYKRYGITEINKPK